MAMVLNLLQELINIYQWALIIYILMSWFPNARDTAPGRLLARVCEPYLEPFRRIIPPIGMMDISPIVAFLVLNFAIRGINRLALWL